jgi:hypothetical protein
MERGAQRIRLWEDISSLPWEIVRRRTVTSAENCSSREQVCFPATMSAAPSRSAMKGLLVIPTDFELGTRGQWSSNNHRKVLDSRSLRCPVLSSSMRDDRSSLGSRHASWMSEMHLYICTDIIKCTYQRNKVHTGASLVPRSGCLSSVNLSPHCRLTT